MNRKHSIRGEDVLWVGITALAAVALLAQVVGARETGAETPSRRAEQRPAQVAALPVAASPVAAAEARTPGVTPPADGTGHLLVEAVVQIESGGRPDSVGLHGERGLMQIKAETWQEVTLGLFGDACSFERAFEPKLNRRVGRAYLESMGEFVDRHRALWKSDRRSLLLACYNAGPTRVRRSEFDLARLPASTRDYVERVGSLHDALVEDTGLDARMARADASADPDLARRGS